MSEIQYCHYASNSQSLLQSASKSHSKIALHFHSCCVLSLQKSQHNYRTFHSKVRLNSKGRRRFLCKDKFEESLLFYNKLHEFSTNFCVLFRLHLSPFRLDYHCILNCSQMDQLLPCCISSKQALQFNCEIHSTQEVAETASY